MNCTPQNVVLLGATPSVGLQVVHCLARTGRYRVVAASVESSHLLQHSAHCRHKQLVDWHWTEEPAQLVKALPNMRGAILVPILTQAIQWMARHREALRADWAPSGIPETAAFDVAHDKVKALEHAHRVGLEAPQVERIESSSLSRIDEIVQRLGLPMLVKPTLGTGGEGICMVRTPSELRARINALQDPASYHLESFVPGDDLSCGVLFHQGRLQAALGYEGITRRKKYGPFRSIRTLHSPAMLRYAEQYLDSLRWDGPANLDFRRAPDGRLYLLDVNPRCWGNIRSLLVAGINFPDLLCQFAMGRAPEVPPLCPDPPAPPATYLSPVDALTWLLNRIRHPRSKPSHAWRWSDSSLRNVMSDPRVYWQMMREPVQSAGGWRRHLNWLVEYAQSTNGTDE